MGALFLGEVVGDGVLFLKLRDASRSCTLNSFQLGINPDARGSFKIKNKFLPVSSSLELTQSSS